MIKEGGRSSRKGGHQRGAGNQGIYRGWAIKQTREREWLKECAWSSKCVRVRPDEKDNDISQSSAPLPVVRNQIQLKTTHCAACFKLIPIRGTSALPQYVKPTMLLWSRPVVHSLHELALEHVIAAGPHLAPLSSLAHTLGQSMHMSQSNGGLERSLSMLASASPSLITNSVCGYRGFHKYICRHGQQSEACPFSCASVQACTVDSCGQSVNCMCMQTTL